MFRYNKNMIKKQFFLFFLLLLHSLESVTVFILDKTKQYKICIVIPAYNEQDRIANTLTTYIKYFKTISYLKVTFLVVANNCKDNTVQICKKLASKHKSITLIDIAPGGKGLAVKTGFERALKSNYDLIGFVDADMATLPEHFYDLIEAANGHDGAIASRYCKGAQIISKTSYFKKLNGNLFNWIIKKRFKFPFEDTQCGAKIFTHDTIALVTPDMQERGWYFDIELLYLCTINGKSIVEVPTTWKDQPGSHFQFNLDRMKEIFKDQNKVLKRHATKAKKYFAQQKQVKRETRAQKRREKRLRRQTKKSKKLIQRYSASKQPETKKKSARYLI